MDDTNGRKETHDFMNVDSFSQLPFIRRTPPKEKAAIIRLFGQELVGDNSDNNLLAADSSETKNEEISKNNKEKDNSNRRFECHYCFRNFPTSQALGGHQNAHKRERQHAKRGSMTSYLHPHYHQSDSHYVYGFLNHHRQYPSWTNETRFYNEGRVQQTRSYHSRTSLPHPPNPPTLNGSPLGLWRVPSSTSAKALQVVYSDSPASTYRTHEKESTKELNWPYRLKKPNVQDHVSLDLRL